MLEYEIEAFGRRMGLGSLSLNDRGMAQLDMRSAFDWLVLYAVAVEDDEAMSERLAAVIASLYE